MSAYHYKQVSPIIAWTMCIIGALFYSYEYLLRVAPSVMIPYIMNLYQVNAKEVGVLSAYYFYTYTPLQLVVGTLLDHYGVRILLTIATIACALGAWFFGFGAMLWTAKFGRAMIGFGSAFAFVGVMKIAADWLPNKWFALMAGITTALGMLGAIGGELVLSDLIGWVGVQQTIGACIVVGGIITILTWGIIRDPKARLTKKKGSDEVASLFKDLIKIIKIPKLWLVSIISLCLFMPTTVFAGLWSVRFLQDVYHVGTHAGLFSSLIFLGWAIGGPMVGLITSYVQSRKTTLLVGSLGALLCSILLIYQPHHELHILATLLFLLGVFSSVQILTFAINHDLTPQHLCGTAIALTNMIVMCGGFLQPLVGSLLDNHQKYAVISTSSFDTSDYQIALMMLPISFFLAFILLLFYKEVPTRTD